jgi:hypothetical protein
MKTILVETIAVTIIIIAATVVAIKIENRFYILSFVVTPATAGLIDSHATVVEREHKTEPLRSKNVKIVLV